MGDALDYVQVSMSSELIPAENCTCNAGFTGPGITTECTACAVGTYKPVHGSDPCSSCEAGTYLDVTGGSVCLSCPANTGSLLGSDAITDCICNVGYEGTDGAACS
eukprot:349768-Rhodomonas_salina.1